MISDFYHMTTAEQISQFKNHSLDEQYELFIFGNQEVHPPAIYLAPQFAKRGPTVVPFLRAKLESVQNEETVRDIVTILAELARMKLYDFSKNVELMELLEQKANNMQGIWKKITLEMIAEIRSKR